MPTGRVVKPRWREPEDDAGIEAVLSVIEDALSDLKNTSLDEEARLAAADIIRWEYIQGRLDGKQLPESISLAETKKQLDDLANTATKFSDALKAVHNNPNVAGRFHYFGLNLHDLRIASELPILAKTVKKELPSSEKARWSKANPTRDLCLSLGHVYYLATGLNPKSGILHERKDGTNQEDYFGPFLKLFEAVRNELNAQAGKEVYPKVLGRTLLKYLKERE